MSFNTLIIMNEDTVGYSQKARRPSGYCKLTMPNRLVCYVQGLTQLPKGQNYRLYLMSKDKEKRVAIGKFDIDKEGSKEIRWTIEPSNINNSKIEAREIDAAIITVEGDGTKGLNAPLVGFAKEPYAWVPIMAKSEPRADEVPTRKVDEVIEIKPTISPETIPERTLEQMRWMEPAKVEPSIQAEKPIEVAVDIEVESSVKEEAPPMELIADMDIETRVEIEKEQSMLRELITTAGLDKIEFLSGEVGLLRETNNSLNEENTMLKIENRLLKDRSLLGRNISQKQLTNMKLEEECWDCKKENLDLKQEIQELQGEIAGIRELNVGLEVGIQELQNENAVLREENKGLNETNQGLVEANMGLNEANTSLNEANMGLNETNMGLNEALVGVNKENEGLVSKNQQLSDKINDLNNENDNLKMKIEALNAKIEELNVKVEELNNKIEELGKCNEKPMEPEKPSKPEENKPSKPTCKPIFPFNPCPNSNPRMEEVFDKSMPMNPFESPEPNVKWVRITQSELMSLPQLSYKWASQPLVINSYNRYKHLIMGKDENIGQYYLGIPDTFSPKKLDILKIDRVMGFRCCRNLQPTVGEHGYWIAGL